MKLLIFNNAISVKIVKRKNINKYKKRLKYLYGLNTFSNDGYLLALNVADPRDDRNIYLHRKAEMLARFMTMSGFKKEIPIKQFHRHLIEFGEISRLERIPVLKTKIRMEFLVINKNTFKNRPCYTIRDADKTFDEYLKQRYELL